MKYVLLLVSLISFSACSFFGQSSELKALNEAQAVGSPFTQYLTEYYRELANRQNDNDMDYADALHFARKGLISSRGDIVLPENLSDWDLRPDHYDVLSPSRAQLLTLFDLGAREQYPELAARAQVNFDCWVEGVEDNWDSVSSACRDEFQKVIEQLSQKVSTISPPLEPVKRNPIQVDPSQPMKIEDAKYLIFFDYDKSVVTETGKEITSAVLDEVKTQNVPMVVIAGHTDTKGTMEYNQKLSLRRARAIKNILMTMGLREDRIMIESFGETQLLVNTADETREPSNRRVEITFSQ